MYFNVEYILYNVFSIHIHVFYYFIFWRTGKWSLSNSVRCMPKTGSFDVKVRKCDKWGNEFQALGYYFVVHTAFHMESGFPFVFSLSLSSPIVNENKYDYADCHTHIYKMTATDQLLVVNSGILHKLPLSQIQFNFIFLIQWSNICGIFNYLISSEFRPLIDSRKWRCNLKKKKFSIPWF